MAVGEFDDRGTDVPGGVTRPVERVLVVGAGMAGLTVANALSHAGVDCVVLEARDRTGGRLLFVGEHTQSARLAYAGGALTSGIREAKRLLGTPAVRLTVNHASKGA